MSDAAAPPRSHRPSPWLAASGALVAFVFAVNVYRAATQAITHDEARTYFWFAAAPWDVLLNTFDANHHVLNSILIKLATSVLGVSDLTVRLPALFGGLLYLVAVLQLARLALGNGWRLLAATAALSLNPFVLDFLSAARGYGLALGLLFAAAWQLAAYLTDDEPVTASPQATAARPRWRGRWLLASLSLGLAVAANFTFVFPATALGVAFVALLWIDRRLGASLPPATRRLRAVLLWFVLPGTLALADLTFGPLLKARVAHFYLGSPGLAATARGLVDASLRYHDLRWPLDASGRGFEAVVAAVAWVLLSLLVIATILGVAASLRRWRRADRWAALPAFDRLRLLLGGTFLLTLTALVAAHAAAGLQYPVERTGLYLVPLTTFALLLAVQRRACDTTEAAGNRAGPRSVAAALPWVLVVMLVAQYLAQFNVSHYREWRYDAGTVFV